MIEDYQTVDVVIVRAPAKDRWGEPTSGSGARVAARATYSSSRRIIRTPLGEEIQASGVFAFGPGFVIGTDDRILYGGRELRPIQVNRPQTLDGEISTRVFVS